MNGEVLIMGKSGGGSGGGLNFKVVGGTTQPSGAANTIWINTSVAITEWMFVAAKPTAAGTAGQVAIVALTANNDSSAPCFNALKKNRIYLKPAVAYQYVSGAWVQKVGKTYRSGSWVGWEYTAVPTEASYWTLSAGSYGGASITADGYASISASYYGQSLITSRFTVDTTNYRTVTITVTGLVNTVKFQLLNGSTVVSEIRLSSGTNTLSITSINVDATLRIFAPGASDGYSYNSCTVTSLVFSG